MSDKIEAFSACCYDTRVDPSKDLIGNAIQEIKREYLFAIKTWERLPYLVAFQGQFWSHEMR